MTEGTKNILEELNVERNLSSHLLFTGSSNVEPKFKPLVSQSSLYYLLNFKAFFVFSLLI